MLAVPFYLVVFRRRVGFAFLAGWFFIVAESHFSVHYRLNLYERGLIPSASDTTSIGLTMFTGWMVAAPYCCVLLLVRVFLERLGLIGNSGGEQGVDDQATATVEPNRDDEFRPQP